MPTAKDLYDHVRAAQEKLGIGEVEEALGLAEPLREQSIQLLNKGAALTSIDRGYAVAAYAYATITMILGLAESRMPAEFIPQIRRLAKDAFGRHRPGSDVWKTMAAAAEVLARAGDSQGAVWAVRKAQQLNPNDDQLTKVAGGISSMYPRVFSEMGENVPDDPPELPSTGR